MGYNFQRNHMSTRTPVDPYNFAGGASVSVTLADGVERIIPVDAAGLPKSITGYRASGDTITIKSRPDVSSTWVTIGAYTADFQLAVRDPVQAISIQRTAGSGTTSKVVVTCI